MYNCWNGRCATYTSSVALRRHLFARRETAPFCPLCGHFPRPTGELPQGEGKGFPPFCAPFRGHPRTGVPTKRHPSCGIPVGTGVPDCPPSPAPPRGGTRLPPRGSSRRSRVRESARLHIRTNLDVSRSPSVLAAGGMEGMYPFRFTERMNAFPTVL